MGNLHEPPRWRPRVESPPDRSAQTALAASARTPDRSRVKSTSHRSATRRGRPDNSDARDRLTQVCPSLRPRRSASHPDVGTAPFALSPSPGGRRGETTTGASTQRQTSQDLGVQAGPRGCCVAPPQGSADPTVRGSRRRRRWPPRDRKGRPAEPARPPSTRGPHRPQDNASRAEPCPDAVVIAGRRSARGAPAERPRQPRDQQQRGDTRYYVAPPASWRADQLQPRALPVESPRSWVPNARCGDRTRCSLLSWRFQAVRDRSQPDRVSSRARPQGGKNDYRCDGGLRIRPNRPGPSRTERGLEIDLAPLLTCQLARGVLTPRPKYPPTACLENGGLMRLRRHFRQHACFQAQRLHRL